MNSRGIKNITRENFMKYGIIIELLQESKDGWEIVAEVFLLDKPICLNKGIWHEVISLPETSCVKITENLEVM